MTHNIDEMKRLEAEFFDKSAHSRTVFGQIPMEADIRRATRFIPSSPDQEAIDPRMTNLLEGKYRDRLIKYVAHRPAGKVLDICCGPGWLALELGRFGQTVDAYDLSPKAIALARRMLDENPYKKGFGKVTYHLEDVTSLDLGKETIDSISGWSAFHHLPDLMSFMDQVNQALKPGGIVATCDDLPVHRLSVWLGRFFRLILPTYDRNYRQKIRDSIRRIRGITKEKPEYFTPMEEVSAKDKSVFDFADYLYDKFDILFDVRFNAFACGPAMTIKGPDWFRYSVARMIIGLDRVLCRLGICKGFLRIIVARKRDKDKK
jgi:SAM-dependent methyltransferase